MQHLRPGHKIYLMGIAGKGMASVAGLLQQAGYTVMGSDAHIYPPMSDMLARLGVPVMTPYDPENLARCRPDIVVVANALSADHPEVAALAKSGLPYTSFPALLHNVFLRNPQSFNVIVAGTHGKTTVSGWLVAILEQLGVPLNYLVGGIAKDRERSFNWRPDARIFVIEGDEYDTAFFDKKAKFFHYNPSLVLLNNIEFDHADIYPDRDAVVQTFAALARLVSDPSNVVANMGSAGVCDTLQQLPHTAGVTRFGTVTCRHLSSQPQQSSCLWTHQIEMDSRLHTVTSPLAGDHNGQNLSALFAVLSRLAAHGLVPADPARWASAAATFPGMKNRLDVLGNLGGVTVYRDYAHHPTSVSTMITTLRQAHPGCRIAVAFDPANATSRRSVFETEYSQAFRHSDVVWIGPVREDPRIAPEDLFRPERVAKTVGNYCVAVSSHDALVADATLSLRPGDVFVAFSSGTFGNVPERVAAALAARSQSFSHKTSTCSSRSEAGVASCDSIN